jgi:hypothetical protein
MMPRSGSLELVAVALEGFGHALAATNFYTPNFAKFPIAPMLPSPF